MGSPADGDPRTHAERMGDGMETVADLALGSDRLPTTGGQRPHLTVIADLDALREQCPTHPSFTDNQNDEDSSDEHEDEDDVVGGASAFP